MSWIGNLFKGAGENLVGGLVSGGIGAITSNLFGGNKKQSFETTRKQQYLLNQDAASLNYQYAAKAATDAYERQKEMYERSYEDQSYQAMRKQMEDAGLSVGLMYGGSGSGGGSGQMSGAPMAAPGGIQGASATQAYGMALQAKQLQLQERQVNADAALKNAEAANLRSQSKKTEQDVDIHEFERMYNKELERAVKDYADWDIHIKWTDMNQKKLDYYFNEYLKLGRKSGWDYTLGDYDFEDNAAAREIEANIKKTLAQAADAQGRADLVEFEKTLKSAQAYNQFMAITVMLAHNEIEKAKTAIMDYTAKYQTGELWNWKTVLDAAVRVIGGVAPLAAMAM